MDKVLNSHPVRCLSLHWFKGREWYLAHKIESIEKFNISVTAALDNTLHTLFSQVFFKVLSSVKMFSSNSIDHKRINETQLSINN